MPTLSNQSPEFQPKATTKTTAISTTTASDDSLIQYALGSDDYLDQFLPIIKSELMAEGSLDKLVVRLEDTLIEKQETLEGISFNSVDDLTNSIDSIANIVEGSGNLSLELESIKSELSKTGQELIEKKTMSLSYKRLYNKINETIMTINSCLDMLDKTNKVLDLIHNKDFYKALMNLDLLTKSRVDELEDFDFITRIHDSIPTFRNMIINQTLSQLLKWFNVSLEKNLVTIGILLFDNFSRLNDHWSDRQESDRTLIDFMINSPIERTLRVDEFKFFNPLENSTIQLDLGPLYHSILVFQSINEFDRLKDDFSNELLRKRDRLISPIKEAIDNNSLDIFKDQKSFKAMIYSLTAYFVSDRLITSKTQYMLRNKVQTSDLFESVISKFIPILKAHVEKCKNDGNQLNELKETIGMFIQILENYEFDIESLYPVLIRVFELHIEIASKEFIKGYQESTTTEEDTQPMIAENENQLLSIQSTCFYKFKVQNVVYPVTLPFSVIYATTCFKLRGFISSLYSFLFKYYNHKKTLILRLIGSSIDNLLINVILRDLNTKIQSAYKEEISQNLINLEFFSNSVIDIQKYLNYENDSVIARFRSASTPVLLHAEAEYKKVRAKAEEGMFHMVDDKIDMLFEMVEFDWEKKQVNDEPSIGIKDMSLFLKNIFLLDFSYLPFTIKSLLLIRTFDKLVTFLKNSIFQTNFITKESVGNFETDINYIESIIPSLKHQDGGDRRGGIDSESESSNLALETIFVGLKQIIELLKEGSLDCYKEDTIRMRKYNTIKPEEAIDLIQKLEDYQNLLREAELNEQMEQQSQLDTIDDEPTRSLFGLKRQSSSSTASPAKISTMFSFNKK